VAGIRPLFVISIAVHVIIRIDGAHTAQVAGDLRAAGMHVEGTVGAIGSICGRGSGDRLLIGASAQGEADVEPGHSFRLLRRGLHGCKTVSQTFSRRFG
jgi:hypothetical protein